MGCSHRRVLVIGYYLINVATFLYSWKHLTVWKFVVEPVLLLHAFAMLGLVTSDFLIPSLSFISRNILHISDRVAGMTLLAVGNAVPDISSTYQSMKRNATSLAVGELVGGVFFLTTVVFGSMICARNVHLYTQPLDCGHEEVQSGTNTIEYDRQEFLKDVLLYFFLIAISSWFLSDGQLRLWESFIMVLSYIIYITMAIRKHYFSENITKASIPERLDANSVDIFSNTAQEEPVDQFNQGTSERRSAIRKRIRNYMRMHYRGWVRMTLRDLLNIWEYERLSKKASLCDVENSYMDTEDTPLLRSVMSLQEHTLRHNPHCLDAPNLTSVEREGRSLSPFHSTKAFERPYTGKSMSFDCLPYLSKDENFNHSPIDARSQTASTFASAKQQPILVPSPKLYKFLNDASISFGFAEIGTLLITTPLSAALTVIVPWQNSFIEEKQPALSKMCIAQLTISSILTWFALYEKLQYWFMALMLAFFGVLIYLRRANINGYNHKIIAVSGFSLSLVIIFLTVHAIVRTLTNWTEEYKISQSILGLTIFAWGNSVGDLVSNITFIKVGLLDVALGACFGSPLLYFLFGIGIDSVMIILGTNHNWSLKHILKQHVSFKVDSHLLFSSIGILIGFCVFTIMVPLNNWKLDQKIGMLLIFIYFCITGLNVYIEMT